MQCQALLFVSLSFKDNFTLDVVWRKSIAALNSMSESQLHL